MGEEPGQVTENEPMQPEQPPEQIEPERPSFVTIQTPLDRPEFDFFLNQYMNKLGLKDKKQAAIQLTNMLYDAGLDPYADLKDLQGTMKQITGLLQGLPDGPQAQQVKETLGAVYTAKVGNILMKKIPELAKAGSSDNMQDRMQAMMDRYMPMIIAANMMSKMANMGGSETQQQQAKPATVDMPEEYKKTIANLESQVAATQELLKEAAAEKKQKEHDELIINTISQNFNPQLASLASQVEALTGAYQAKAAEPPPRQEPTSEMAAITRQLDELKNSLAIKEKTGLNLSDLDTVMSTIETLEKRIRKDVPAGEFDWKATTMSTLGEIGKEVVTAFKEVNLNKSQQPNMQGPTSAAGQQSAPSGKAVAKQKLQSYIMQNLSKGVQELRMDDAQRELSLSPQEIIGAYNELVTEGWIKAKPDGKQPPTTPPTPLPQQPPGPPPSGEAAAMMPHQQPQQVSEDPTRNLHPGEQPRDRFDANAPFLER